MAASEMGNLQIYLNKQVKQTRQYSLLTMKICILDQDDFEL